MFRNRKVAGELLADMLHERFHGVRDGVVCGMPRGGVVVAAPVAGRLKLPLRTIVARKVGHPNAPEYAIAAVTEGGEVVQNEGEVALLSEEWFRSAVEKERQEASRRTAAYNAGLSAVPLRGKTVILVDDGVATGLTLEAALLSVVAQKPARIIVAVPVLPASVAARLRRKADEVLALKEEQDADFLGAVGAYYQSFPQVSDEEVLNILHAYDT